MSRRLILTCFLLCGLLSAGIAEAKVCFLGDVGCEFGGNLGPNENSCDASYKGCTDPRSGATYCGQKIANGNIMALYKDEDCCASLPYYGKTCPEENNEIGYGKSCRGAKSNITYWEFCGCGYGFVDIAPDREASTANSIEGTIKDEDGREVPYTARCGYDGEQGNEKCKLAICNTERRWFAENSGDYCLYRMPTRCGGFGCKQLYDCDNSNDYYRSEDLRFKRTSSSAEVENYIEYLPTDPWGNEKDKDAKIWYITGPGGDSEYREYLPKGIMLPYGKKVKADIDDDIVFGEYEVTNKIVCGYLGHNGSNDTTGGFDCNNLRNYCYKWNGCNVVKGWYDSNINMGVLYGEIGRTISNYDTDLTAYEHWMNEVERDNAYNDTHYYLGNLNIKPATALGEGFDLHAGNYTLRESFYQKAGNYGANKYDEAGKTMSRCGKNENDSPCKITDTSKGCTYITHACHHNNANCYKRISCSEENRFYHSFINAARNAFNSEGGSLMLGTVKKDDDEINVLYNSSLNDIYWKDFYKAESNDGEPGLDPREIYPACIYRINACNDTVEGGIYGGGCYRKEGCIENFEDIYDHLTIEQDWMNWFKDWRPICNDNTRCYQASSCDLEGGAYSSEPNTSFFNTIQSTATLSTCYRGANCNFEAGSYSSVPNISFFYTIESLATGSTCYRGQNCNFEAGSYSSTPNTSFFYTSDSVATGSICYRGEGCQDEVGAYASEPNTLFFKTIASEATGTTCYRGEECGFDAGAYSSEPNTIFFKVIDSAASGSICYRAQCCTPPNCELETPDTSFFYAIYSEASEFHNNKACYRAPGCFSEIGSYSSTPNTAFFTTVSSVFGGACKDARGICPGFKAEETTSICYRGKNCNLENGAYSSIPNTSFFYTIDSIASGSICYRGEGCREEAGVYISEPNTAFFKTIASEATGTTCYRGEECNLNVGAYSSIPNISFFVTIDSYASGSICYRGQNCNFEAGAYSSTPNTSFFFEPIHSEASGLTCYRKNDGKTCNTEAGSYPIEEGEVTLNTSYFFTIESMASGTSCYRASRCHSEIGAYSSSPNTSFFNLVTSLQSWKSICYRAHGCNEQAGAREGEPCTAADKSECFAKEGGFCYAEEGCLQISDIDPRYFKIIISTASGSACYRGDRCSAAAGSYVNSPNTSFFIPSNKVSPEPVKTVCYRGAECNLEAGAYTSSPNTHFFSTIASYASGSTCYRVKECSSEHKANNGPCANYPDKAFFEVEYSEPFAGYVCARPTKCIAKDFAINGVGARVFKWEWDTWDDVSCPYITEPVQSYNDINYCIYNRTVVPSPYDEGGADVGKWQFTKGTTTVYDENIQPECAREYANTGTITKDECGKVLKKSGGSISSYIPVGCNTVNGWDERSEKLKSCYFNASSSTINAFMPKILNNTPDENGNVIYSKNNFDVEKKELTCYKYTTPRITKGNFASAVQCAFDFTVVKSDNQPYGIPNDKGGTKNNMTTCSDGTKVNNKTTIGINCGDQGNILTAEYPSSCNKDHGWYNLLTDDITPQGIINDAINTRYFSKREVTIEENSVENNICYNKLTCYQPVSPLCRASSDIYKVEKVEAIGGEACSIGKVTSTYATGCNTANGYYPKIGFNSNSTNVTLDEETLNASYFGYEPVKIKAKDNCGHNEVTCYHIVGCVKDPHPNWCNVKVVKQDKKSCTVDNGCKTGADEQYFEVTHKECDNDAEMETCTGVATEPKCTKADTPNSSAFTWTSVTLNNNYQKISDSIASAEYPTGCRGGYYTTSQIAADANCDTNYFKFGDGIEATGCGHSVTCKQVTGCAQEAPNTCIYKTTNKTCKTQSCTISAGCKTSPSSAYFTTDEVGGCSYATGVVEECQQENTDIFTWMPTSQISCSSIYATNGSYTAYSPLGCNDSNGYYTTTKASEYGINYYKFGKTIPQPGCGNSSSVSCRKFEGCVENAGEDKPSDVCYLKRDNKSYIWEPKYNTATYCKYDCKEIPEWVSTYFEIGSKSYKGENCDIVTRAKCGEETNTNVFEWASTSVSCKDSLTDDIPLMSAGSLTSHYVTGCAITKDEEKFTYRDVEISEDCDPNNVLSDNKCPEAIGCNESKQWYKGSCPQDWKQYNNLSSTQNGIKCIFCMPNIERTSLTVVVKQSDEVVPITSETGDEEEITKLNYGEIIYLVEYNNDKIAETKTIKILDKDGKETNENNFSIKITPTNPSGYKQYIANCQTGSDTCGTPSDEEKTYHECKSNETECEYISACNAEFVGIGNNKLSIEIPVDGAIGIGKISSVNCTANEPELKKCVEYNYYNQSEQPAGWTCNKRSIKASDGPCYSCTPVCPAGWGDKDNDGKPDSNFFKYKSTSYTSRSGKTKTCYQATACNNDQNSGENEPNDNFNYDGPKTYPGKTCYHALSCKDGLNSAEWNNCSGILELDSSHKYQSLKCPFCATCASKGYTSDAPTYRDKFFFNIKTREYKEDTTIRNKNKSITCYQTQGCNSSNIVSGEGNTNIGDCHEYKDGYTCGVNLPTHLKVNTSGSSSVWSGQSTNNFSVTSIEGYTISIASNGKLETSSANLSTPAYVSFSGYSWSNYIASSTNLTKWTAHSNTAKSSPAILFSGNQEFWGTKDAENRAQYKTNFVVRDTNNRVICQVDDRNICVNDCDACIARCEEIPDPYYPGKHLVTQCPDGMIAEHSITGQRCGLTCYSGCFERVPVPPYFVVNYKLERTDFVCEKNKYAYELTESKVDYRDDVSGETKKLFSEMTMSGVHGKEVLQNKNLYTNSSYPEIKITMDTMPGIVATMNPKNGTYSITNPTTNNILEAKKICAANETELSQNLAEGFKITGYNGNVTETSGKKFKVYELDYLSNVTINGNPIPVDYGKINGNDALMKIAVNPIINDNTGISPGSAPEDEDPCRFEEVDGTVITDGFEGVNNASASQIAYGKTLISPDSDMKDYFNYVYLEPCYANLECRRDNLLIAKLEEIDEKIQDNMSRTIFNEVKSWYITSSKTVLGKTCSIIVGHKNECITDAAYNALSAEEKVKYVDFDEFKEAWQNVEPNGGIDSLIDDLMVEIKNNQPIHCPYNPCSPDYYKASEVLQCLINASGIGDSNAYDVDKPGTYVNGYTCYKKVTCADYGNTIGLPKLKADTESCENNNLYAYRITVPNNYKCMSCIECLPKRTITITKIIANNSDDSREYYTYRADVEQGIAGIESTGVYGVFKDGNRVSIPGYTTAPIAWSGRGNDNKEVASFEIFMNGEKVYPNSDNGYTENYFVYNHQYFEIIEQEANIEHCQDIQSYVKSDDKPLNEDAKNIYDEPQNCMACDADPISKDLTFGRKCYKCVNDTCQNHNIENNICTFLDDKPSGDYNCEQREVVEGCDLTCYECHEDTCEFYGRLVGRTYYNSIPKGKTCSQVNPLEIPTIKHNLACYQCEDELDNNGHESVTCEDINPNYYSTVQDSNRYNCNAVTAPTGETNSKAADAEVCSIDVSNTSETATHSLICYNCQLLTCDYFKLVEKCPEGQVGTKNYPQGEEGGLLCYSDCHEPTTCEEYGRVIDKTYYDAPQDGMDCSRVDSTTVGDIQWCWQCRPKTCPEDESCPKVCEDFNYESYIPNGYNCETAVVENLFCYTNCKKSCDYFGEKLGRKYFDEKQDNMECSQIIPDTVEGLTCYQCKGGDSPYNVCEDFKDGQTGRSYHSENDHGCSEVKVEVNGDNLLCYNCYNCEYYYYYTPGKEPNGWLCSDVNPESVEGLNNCKSCAEDICPIPCPDSDKKLCEDYDAKYLSTKPENWNCDYDNQKQEVGDLLCYVNCKPTCQFFNANYYSENQADKTCSMVNPLKVDGIEYCWQCREPGIKVCEDLSTEGHTYFSKKTEGYVCENEGMPIVINDGYSTELLCYENCKPTCKYFNDKYYSENQADKDCSMVEPSTVGGIEYCWQCRGKPCTEEPCPSPDPIKVCEDFDYFSFKPKGYVCDDPLPVEDKENNTTLRCYENCRKPSITISTKILQKKHLIGHWDEDIDEFKPDETVVASAEEVYTYTATSDFGKDRNDLVAKFTVTFDNDNSNTGTLVVGEGKLEAHNQCVFGEIKSEEFCLRNFLGQNDSKKITSFKLLFDDEIVYESDTNLPFYYGTDKVYDITTTTKGTVLEFAYQKENWTVEIKQSVYGETITCNSINKDYYDTPQDWGHCETVPNERTYGLTCWFCQQDTCEYFDYYSEEQADKMCSMVDPNTVSNIKYCWQCQPKKVCEDLSTEGHTYFSKKTEGYVCENKGEQTEVEDGEGSTLLCYENCKPTCQFFKDDYYSEKQADKDCSMIDPKTVSDIKYCWQCQPKKVCENLSTEGHTYFSARPEGYVCENKGEPTGVDDGEGSTLFCYENCKPTCEYFNANYYSEKQADKDCSMVEPSTVGGIEYCWQCRGKPCTEEPCPSPDPIKVCEDLSTVDKTYFSEIPTDFRCENENKPTGVDDGKGSTLFCYVNCGICECGEGWSEEKPNSYYFLYETTNKTCKDGTEKEGEYCYKVTGCAIEKAPIHKENIREFLDGVHVSYDESYQEQGEYKCADYGCPIGYSIDGTGEDPYGNDDWYDLYNDAEENIDDDDEAMQWLFDSFELRMYNCYRNKICNEYKDAKDRPYQDLGQALAIQELAREQGQSNYECSGPTRVYGLACYICPQCESGWSETEPDKDFFKFTSTNGIGYVAGEDAKCYIATACKDGKAPISDDDVNNFLNVFSVEVGNSKTQGELRCAEYGCPSGYDLNERDEKDRINLNIEDWLGNTYVDPEDNEVFEDWWNYAEKVFTQCNRHKYCNEYNSEYYDEKQKNEMEKKYNNINCPQVNEKEVDGLKCYTCPINCPIGWGAKEPDSEYFKYTSSSIDTIIGSVDCYRIIGCNTDKGYYDGIPDSDFFTYDGPHTTTIITDQTLVGRPGSISVPRIIHKIINCSKVTSCNGTANSGGENDKPSDVFASTSKTYPNISGLSDEEYTTCYHATGCASDYVDASAWSECGGILDGFAIYHNLTCAKCETCETKGYVATSTVEDNFYFNIEEKTFTEAPIYGRGDKSIKCYKATGCSSKYETQEVSEDEEADCNGEMSGLKCGIYLPTDLQGTVQKNSLVNALASHKWENTSEKTLLKPEYWNVVNMRTYNVTYNADGTMQTPMVVLGGPTNSYLPAHIGFTGHGSSNYISNSQNGLKIWSPMFLNSSTLQLWDAGNTTVLFDNGNRELWGNTEPAERTKYQTRFKVIDENQKEICIVTKPICLNDCPCIAKCEDTAGYISKEPTGQTCTKESISNACGGTSECYNASSCHIPTCEDFGYVEKCPDGQTGEKVETEIGLICYKDCHEIGYFPQYLSIGINYEKSNYVCATDKYLYRPTSDIRYEDKDHKRIDFGDVTFTGTVTTFDRRYRNQGNEGGFNLFRGIPVDIYARRANEYEGYNTKNGENDNYLGKYTLITAKDSVVGTPGTIIDNMIGYLDNETFGGKTTCLREDEAFKLGDLVFSIKILGAGRADPKDAQYLGLESYSMRLLNDDFSDLCYKEECQKGSSGISMIMELNKRDGEGEVKNTGYRDGDMCEFKTNEADTRQMINGEEQQISDDGTFETKNGIFIFSNDIKKDLSSYFNYTYISPCYADMSCIYENPWTKLEQAGYSADAINELRKLYVVEEKTAGNLTCAKSSRCATGCYEEGTLIDMYKDVSEPWYEDYTWADEFLDPYDSDAVYKFFNVDCACPKNKQCSDYDPNYYDSAEKCPANTAIKVDETLVGGLTCYRCAKCSDINEDYFGENEEPSAIFNKYYYNVEEINIKGLKCYRAYFDIKEVWLSLRIDLGECPSHWDYTQCSSYLGKKSLAGGQLTPMAIVLNSGEVIDPVGNIQLVNDSWQFSVAFKDDGYAHGWFGPKCYKKDSWGPCKVESGSSIGVMESCQDGTCLRSTACRAIEEKWSTSEATTEVYVSLGTGDMKYPARVAECGGNQNMCPFDTTSIKDQEIFNIDRQDYAHCQSIYGCAPGWWADVSSNNYEERTLYQTTCKRSLTSKPMPGEHNDAFITRTKPDDAFIYTKMYYNGDVYYRIIDCNVYAGWDRYKSNVAGNEQRNLPDNGTTFTCYR